MLKVNTHKQTNKIYFNRQAHKMSTYFKRNIPKQQAKAADSF